MWAPLCRHIWRRAEKRKVWRPRTPGRSGREWSPVWKHSHGKWEVCGSSPLPQHLHSCGAPRPALFVHTYKRLRCFWVLRVMAPESRLSILYIEQKTQASWPLGSHPGHGTGRGTNKLTVRIHFAFCIFTVLSRRFSRSPELKFIHRNVSVCDNFTQKPCGGIIINVHLNVVNISLVSSKFCQHYPKYYLFTQETLRDDCPRRWLSALIPIWFSFLL